MASTIPTRQTLGADENDLKNNRLGLLSQKQTETLEEHIHYSRAYISEYIRRAMIFGGTATIGILILLMARLLPFPIAMVVLAGMIAYLAYLTSDFNKFIHALVIDHEAGSVRILRGRISKRIAGKHPLYWHLRVEVHGYRVIDERVYRALENGELYKLYILPQSGVVIAAEHEGELGGQFHF